MVQLTLKNSGRTPARTVETVSVVDRVSRGKEPGFDYAKRRRVVVGSIQPNGEIYITFSLAFQSDTSTRPGLVTQPLLDNLRSEAIKAFFHGQIWYEDIFQRRHWTTFCFYLMAPELDSFGMCEEHNDTSDENAREPSPAR